MTKEQLAEKIEALCSDEKRDVAAKIILAAKYGTQVSLSSPIIEGEGWIEKDKMKNIAVDFLWENVFDKRDGYQKLRALFDQWFSENKYYNPAPPVQS